MKITVGQLKSIIREAKGEWSGLGMGPEHGSVFIRHEPRPRSSARQRGAAAAELQRRLDAVKPLWDNADVKTRMSFLNGDYDGYDRDARQRWSQMPFEEFAAAVCDTEQDKRDLLRTMEWFPWAE